jgi:AraC-like DNA-binding protein
MIRFGSMSILLLLGALAGAMYAALLWWTPKNRLPNRLLALLLLALALYTFPYIIGYAGYYDAYPWLTYFPYKFSLAFGPLLYCHVQAIASPRRHLAPVQVLHFVPVAIQFIYYCVLFIQPLAVKHAWDGGTASRWVENGQTTAELFSLGAYLAWTWRTRPAFGLADPRAEWIRNAMIAMSLTLAAWVALVATERLTSGLDYFQRFPFYAWLAFLVCWLGIKGLAVGIQAMPVVRAKTEPDWPEQGQRWREAIIVQQLWRDPDLTLALLARRLGTNTSTLSKAINEGLGLNFSELINRIRVDAVIAALEKPGNDGPLLDLAFAEGFSSKASFNRLFKQYSGQTPSEYRRAAAPEAISTQP